MSPSTQEGGNGEWWTSVPKGLPRSSPAPWPSSPQPFDIEALDGVRSLDPTPVVAARVHTDLFDDRTAYRPAVPKMAAGEFLVQSLDVFGPMKMDKVLANFAYHHYPIDIARYALLHAFYAKTVRVGTWSQYVWLPGQRHPWLTLALGRIRRGLRFLGKLCGVRS